MEEVETNLPRRLIKSQRMFQNEGEKKKKWGKKTRLRQGRPELSRKLCKVYIPSVLIIKYSLWAL